MLGIVARSVMVYGATAAVLLWLAHRFVRPVGRAPALALAVAPLLLTGTATFTGGIYAPLDIVYVPPPFHSLRASMELGPDRTAILGDVVYQEIPWRKAVRASIKRRELPLWNPYVLAGEPLLATQQPAVLHPATWIGLLLPLAQAWTFEMSLRIFLALLCAWLLLKDLGCRDVAAGIGAAGWAFSNYLTFFLGYPLSPAAAPFPLLLAGLRRLAREPGRRSAGIVVAALFLILTSGHPETVLHSVAAAGLYFAWELVDTRGRHLRAALAGALAAGALSLGLAAPVLLPLAEALPHTAEHLFRSRWYAHAERSQPWKDVAHRLALEVSPMAVSRGVPPQRNEAPFGPSGYAGALLWPLAITGLAGRERSRWFFAALGALGAAVGSLSPAAAILAKLPLFDIAINDRLVFVTAFSLCVLAAFGADRIGEGEGRWAFLAGAAATVVVILGVFRAWAPDLRELGIPADEARRRLALQIVPVLVAAGAVYALARDRRHARIVPVVFLLLLLAERRLEAGELYASFPSKAFYPHLSVLDPIPRSEPYRFAALSFSFIPNVAALYGLEDVRGYEAMTFLPLFETYPMWCTHQPVWFNRVDDPTTPFLAFLNARWILVPAGLPAPSGWKTLSEGEGMRLVENPGALPRAFAPRAILSEPDPARRLAALRAVPDFAERGVVAEGPARGWTPNGRAEVRIARYAADAIDLDVDARDPALVGTSLNAWPGWTISMDGTRLASVSYNHAFVGFRLPAGRHAVALRYRPASFRVGALLGLAALVAGVAFARRRGPRGPS